MRFGLALALVVLAGTATAQTTQRAQPGLTPLGPVQAPRPSGPALPSVIGPQDPKPSIDSQALPSLTPPDPALAPVSPQPVAPQPVAPPVVQPAPQRPAAPSPAPTPATPPAPAAQVPAAPATPGTPIPGDWQARGTVDLTGLDKVTARTTALSGKVGTPIQFGSLTITVRSCVVRAADQPADAAAYVDIVDRGSTPLFRGWMLVSQPAFGVVEHPVYDVRVAGCRN